MKKKGFFANIRFRVTDRASWRLSFWLTGGLLGALSGACQDSLTLDVAGGAFDQDCAEELVCDNQLEEFAFLTGEYISSERSITIEWKELPSADFYRLEVSDHPSCKDPLFTFEEVNPKKEFTFIKDGIYYFCLHSVVARLNEFSAKNNGLKIIIDSTPPIVKVSKSQTILATGGYPVDPEFEVQDLTELSYEWSSLSEKASFDYPNARQPGISFTGTGYYEVNLKVSDSAGHVTEQSFSIQWQPDIDALIADLGVRFEKQRYQTRSVKKLILPPALSYSLEGIKINSSYFYDFRLMQNHAGEFRLLVSKDPSLMSVFDYGEQLVNLTLINDRDNQSKTFVTVKDFPIFSHGSASYSSNALLSGGLAPIGGISKSENGEVLSTGFHSIVHQ